jgi:uncharacterized membrane protein YraQ (UPF0718 family)
MSVSREIPRERSWDGALVAGTLAFLALAIAGLFFVKWFPYWNKAHVAAATHALGPSIVSGKSAAPPGAGLQAAWQFSLSYFSAVWEAVVLALLLGAAVQVFVPRRWILRLLGGNGYKSAAIAGAVSLGGMM